MLQQQVAFLQDQLREANDRLGEANRKVDELLRKVSSLEELLVLKKAEERKQYNIIKGLTKIQQNKSEKQAPQVVSDTEVISIESYPCNGSSNTDHTLFPCSSRLFPSHFFRLNLAPVKTCPFSSVFFSFIGFGWFGILTV